MGQDELFEAGQLNAIVQDLLRGRPAPGFTPAGGGLPLQQLVFTFG
jgi:hypothetical protein